MVFQDFNLLESLNVKDNILLPLILENNTENSEERFEKIMNVLSISDLADKSVTDISGGQKQRVSHSKGIDQYPTDYSG